MTVWRTNFTPRKIITAHVYPPIPTRSFDWSAHYDDYDGAPDSNHPIGTGPTEADAIADLLEQDAGGPT